MQAADHPVEVADQERFIQAEHFLHFCHGFVRDDRHLLHTQCDLGRVGGDQIDEQKTYKGDRQQQRNGHQQPAHNIAFHNDSLSIVVGSRQRPLQQEAAFAAE